MASNTKVDERVTFKSHQPLVLGVAAGGTLNYALSYYSPFDSTASRFNGLLSNVQDFQVHLKLYDEFRLTGFTIRYRPTYNMDSIALLQLNSTVWDTNIYTWVDRDGSYITSAATNVPDKIQSYDSCKMFDYKKAWSRHVKVAPRNGWLDTRLGISTGGIDNNLTANTLFKQQGYVQSLGIYAQNIPTEAVSATGNFCNLGMFQIDWHVQFRGKIPQNVTLNNDGSLTLVSIDKFAPIQPTQPAAVISDESGPLVSYDGSGNPVLVLPGSRPD